MVLLLHLDLMNEVAFFLCQWSVPDCQPVNRQLPVQSVAVRVLAQDDVPAALSGDRLLWCTRNFFCLSHVVNVEFGANVHFVDCLSNYKKSQNT